MPCPVCNHETISTRHVPLEVYGSDGEPLARIPQAQWHTCQRCGACWYPKGTEDLPQVPIRTPTVPVYDASDC